MIDPKYLREVAAVWAEASIKGRKRGRGGVLSFWGIGYNQHIHGQNNTVSLINLMALSGNIGRPGCGPFSMTGQPNAMGERLTGGLTGRLPFNQGIANASWRNWIADAWNVPRPRLEGVSHLQNTGYAVGMMERALKDEVKAMCLIYATHIDLPDLNTLVQPALTKTFNVVQEIYRHAPNNLHDCCGCHRALALLADRARAVVTTHQSLWWQRGKLMRLVAHAFSTLNRQWLEV